MACMGCLGTFFFPFLGIISLVLTIIGFIKPEAVILWGKNRTKSQALMLYGSICFGSFLLFLVSACMIHSQLPATTYHPETSTPVVTSTATKTVEKIITKNINPPVIPTPISFNTKKPPSLLSNKPITAKNPESSHPKEITTEGSGNRASKKIYLNNGLVIFNYEYSELEKNNFSVWLMDDKGKNIALLANEIGTCNGSKAVQIEEQGYYLYNVSATGIWKIKASQQ